MRVIGGAFRGRRLFAPEGTATRPTAAKVREALFDILGERVRDSLFLDLYSGTGAVGIEALSRGAGRAVFVERAGRALAVLRRNLDALGLGPRSLVLPVPAEKALAVLAERGLQVYLAFADPPYAAAGRARVLEALGEAEAVWAPGALLAVEHSAAALPEPPPGFGPVRSYRYGDTGLSLFARPAAS